MALLLLLKPLLAVHAVSRQQACLQLLGALVLPLPVLLELVLPWLLLLGTQHAQAPVSGKTPPLAECSPQGAHQPLP
jgi:hypothetical protein